MLFELRYSRDGFSIEAAIAKNRPLPDWYLDRPKMLPGDDFYLDAFWKLNTTRMIGMDLGPIPWDKCVLYATYMKLDNDIFEHFIGIIMSLDVAYLDWYREKVEAQSNKKPLGNSVNRKK